MDKFYNYRLGISYSIFGKGNSVVLCIHGITRNKNDFYYLAEALANEHTVICVDMPGRGDSAYLDNPKRYNYNNYYHSIINLINDLKIEKVNIIGTSMGGIIAMYVAAYSPHMVNSIVLNDIGPYIDLEALQKLSVHIKEFPTFNKKSEAIDYLKFLLSPLALKEEEHWSHMINNSIRLSNDGNYYLNYHKQIGENFEKNIMSMDQGMDLWHIWEKLDCPILILRGKKSSILTHDTAQRMLNSSNKVRLIEYEGVGHVPSLMETNQINDIRQWLNTISL